MSKKRSEPPVRVEYRDLSRQDVPALKLINNASFPLVYTDDVYNGLLEKPHYHATLAAIPSTNAQGYEVIGAVTWRVKKRTRSFQRITEWWNGFTRESHAYIMTLAVAPEHRRKGVAKMLLAKTLTQMRDCDLTQVSLHMLTTNEPALRLYSGFGFKVLCRLTNYYHIYDTPEDGYWLRKDLRKVSAISEPPVIAPNIRLGPWPFGLSFENFFLLVFACLSLLTLIIVTQQVRYNRRY